MYSPLPLVFRLTFLPVSGLTSSTAAPAMGLPAWSVATPFTVPVVCANTGMARIPSSNTSSVTRPIYLLIFPPALETVGVPAWLPQRSPASIWEFVFMNNPEPQSATDKEWGHWLQPPQKRAAAAHN